MMGISNLLVLEVDYIRMPGDRETGQDAGVMLYNVLPEVSGRPL